MVTVSPPKSEASASWAYALQLPHNRLAPRIARVTLRAVLSGHGLTQLIDTAELLTSELVTNAYRYSTGPATLRLRGLADARLRMSVWDTNPHIPPPFDQKPGPLRPVRADADGGRGLFLVCHYADTWGGFPLAADPFGCGGKLLWCEIGPQAGDGVAAA
ncbi:ATP-binding protein [Streptomyces yerevanensis]|uniref:ATP-binding protein n=1 Tax=Streptomyces yerevanensis TaxID=66378 RepID=UPI00052733D1|nr:ATP-binding protein [Streptomyces yerevanensis]